MDLFQAIEQRHCKRKFFDKPIPKEVLEKVLFSSGNAASSKNSQPWEVTILSGEPKEKLKKLLCEKLEKEEIEDGDYIYMTEPTPEDYNERARKLGYDLFSWKGIARDDRAKRKEHWMENYRFFGAPTVLFFHLHPNSERGNFLDMGLFMQNVMLGLVAEGLGSCPQASLCAFSQTIKKELKIPLERILVCGMSVGYVNEEDKVNDFIPERLPLTSYTTWIE